MSCDNNNAYDLAKNNLNVSGSSNPTRIKSLTQEILNTTDCDALQTKIAISQDEISQLSSNISAEASALASKFQPLMKLPGSFRKIVGYAKKQVTGMVMPQIQAYIKATQLAVEMVSDAQQLTSAVKSVGPYLQECAISTATEVAVGLENDLNTTVNQAVLNITRGVNSGLCEVQNVLLTTDGILSANIVNDAALSVIRDVTEYEGGLEVANQAIDNTLQLIGQVSDLTYEVSGVRLDVDTTDVTNFQTSIASGALTTFAADIQEFIDKPPAINTVAPSISGNVAAVGETLTANVGTWTGDDITYTYQWYRNNVAIQGATSSTYVTTAADSSANLTVEVDASSVGGGDVVEATPVATTFQTGGIYSFGQRIG